MAVRLAQRSGRNRSGRNSTLYSYSNDTLQRARTMIRDNQKSAGMKHQDAGEDPMASEMCLQNRLGLTVSVRNVPCPCPCPA